MLTHTESEQEIIVSFMKYVMMCSRCWLLNSATEKIFIVINTGFFLLFLSQFNINIDKHATPVHAPGWI